MRVIALVHTRL